MKTLFSLKFIFLALVVLGCFANFAQNDYGRLIIVLALLALFLTFLFDTIYFAFKEKKLTTTEVPIKKLNLIILLVGIISGFSLLLSSMNSESGFFIGLIGLILMVSSIVVMINTAGNIKPLFIESMSFLIYCSGILFKFNHWPGASALMILSTILLINYFIKSSIVIFRNERKQSIETAWFFQILFLFIILNLLGTLFKTMHWPLANMIGYLTVFALLFIGVCIVIRKKFNYSSRKVSIWKLIGSIRGNFSLIFIFYTLAAIYFVLSMSNVAPRFNSNFRPVSMDQLLEKENGQERFDKYYNAYYNFMDHRNSVKEKENKK
jgi:hypothetical protein